MRVARSAKSSPKNEMNSQKMQCGSKCKFKGSRPYGKDGKNIFAVFSIRPGGVVQGVDEMCVVMEPRTFEDFSGKFIPDG